MYLGENYWNDRYCLTQCSQALDFLTSDYRNNSYWKWINWRLKYDKDWIQHKPVLPMRFHHIKQNLYIKSIDPPMLNINGNILVKKHIMYRKKVFQ